MDAARARWGVQSRSPPPPTTSSTGARTALSCGAPNSQPAKAVDSRGEEVAAGADGRCEPFLAEPVGEQCAYAGPAHPGEEGVERRFPRPGPGRGDRVRHRRARGLARRPGQRGFQEDQRGDQFRPVMGQVECDVRPGGVPHQVDARYPAPLQHRGAVGGLCGHAGATARAVLTAAVAGPVDDDASEAHQLAGHGRQPVGAQRTVQEHQRFTPAGVAAVLVGKGGVGQVESHHAARLSPDPGRSAPRRRRSPRRRTARAAPAR